MSTQPRLPSVTPPPTVAPIDSLAHAFPPLPSVTTLPLGPTAESNWVIPGLLIAGAYPGNPDPVRSAGKIKRLLERAPVNAFVSLIETGERARFTPYVIPSGVKYVHLPIKDRGVVSDEVAKTYAAAILTELVDGNLVYLHCWGGHGRTGTIVSLLLGEIYGMTSAEALKYCYYAHGRRTQRPRGSKGRRYHTGRSPQSPAQFAQVRRILA